MGARNSTEQPDPVPVPVNGIGQPPPSTEAIKRPSIDWVKSFFDGSVADFAVHVKTGDRKGAGTDANVYIELEDEDGKTTGPITLDNPFQDDHERGETCTFEAPQVVAAGLQNIRRIYLWRDNYGFGANWYVDYVNVENRRERLMNHFPIHRWIKADYRHVFTEFDSDLPHLDLRREQRQTELEEKRLTYEYVMHVAGGPAQIKTLPEDETFSDSYKWDLVTQKVSLIGSTSFKNLYLHFTSNEWSSFDDIRVVYSWYTAQMPEPRCLPYWREDKWFGLQRLQGCNPVMFRLCTEIPQKFAVTSEMVEPSLEGKTLKSAMEARKIFLVDMEIMKDLPTKGTHTLCAPLGLFYLTTGGDFLPIAIQLFQTPGPDNPVFLPSDHPNVWLLAKMYFNNADATYHQSLTHLGYTHLMMEGVVVCSHRNLSASHPLFRLLAPHFLFLLAINSRGLDKLVSPGGWVDKTMTVGRDGMFNLIVRGYSSWRLDLHGAVPKEIESRGVLDHSVLPYYPYRDDSVKIYYAIKRYVSKIVKHFYDSPEKIKEDHELQAWRKELVMGKGDGGVGILGVPGTDDEGITTVDEIIDLVTSVIAICSIGHAATNFLQYEEYAYPPNYPAILLGKPPTSKNPITEADILRQIPPREITLDTMVITKILSSKGTNSLGNFEVQYLFDPVSVKSADEFRKELTLISEHIKTRNKKIATEYFVLDPEIVPNSISI